MRAVNLLEDDGVGDGQARHIGILIESECDDDEVPEISPVWCCQGRHRVVAWRVNSFMPESIVASMFLDFVMGEE